MTYVYERISSFRYRDIIDGILVETEVGLIEGTSKACCQGCHTLHQEGNAEEVDLLLIYVDVNRALVYECIVDSKAAGKTLALRAKNSKFTSGFIHPRIDDSSRG